MSAIKLYQSQDLHDLVYTKGSPFERYRTLIQDIEPSSDKTIIDMTIGAPRHKAPLLNKENTTLLSEDFKHYPTIQGSLSLREAISKWLSKRYDLQKPINPDQNILPINGSREGLYYAAMTANHLKKSDDKKIIIFPNPFYPAYAAATLNIQATALTYTGEQNNGLQKVDTIDTQTLKNTIAIYITSPSYPQGFCADKNFWKEWIKAARQYNFYLFADECYSEIYDIHKPTGLLEAAEETGSLDKVVVFHSLSKRSNMPGLRSGFCAGDPYFIQSLKKLRALAGPQMPEPLQKISTMLWQDQDHVEKNQKLYKEKKDIIENTLHKKYIARPQTGFFLWANTPASFTDEELAQKLWKEQSIKVLPGRYLGLGNKNTNPGYNKLRIALIHDIQTTSEAAKRLQSYFT